MKIPNWRIQVLGLVVAITLDSVAQAGVSTIIISSMQRPGETSPQIVVGFRDSSFEYTNGLTPDNKSFCYIGIIEQACHQIALGIQEMEYKYQQGSHDRAELVACSADDQEVVVAYKLYDDYSSQPMEIKRTLQECLR